MHHGKAEHATLEKLHTQFTKGQADLEAKLAKSDSALTAKLAEEEAARKAGLEELKRWFDQNQVRTLLDMLCMPSRVDVHGTVCVAKNRCPALPVPCRTCGT